jgi:hypothetical protein
MVPKMRIPTLSVGVVEEYSKRAEAGPARAGGLLGSKNVGISSKNQGENP